MKTNILAIVTFIWLLFVSTTMWGADPRIVSPEEAKLWYSNLHNSPYIIYENFDNTVIYYDSIKNHLTPDTHLKFYMGYTTDVKDQPQYRLFMIYIKGTVDTLNQYVNDFSSIYYFNGKNWIGCNKETLKNWSSNWQTHSPSSVNFYKAFAIPYNDLYTISKNEIFISFGLQVDGTEKAVKLILSNIKYNYTNQGNSTKLGDPVVHFDANMPCPKVCGIGDI
jgi:hypothetical protein